MAPIAHLGRDGLYLKVRPRQQPLGPLQADGLQVLGDALPMDAPEQNPELGPAHAGHGRQLAPTHGRSRIVAQVLLHLAQPVQIVGRD